jgi:hypothetical protein
MKLIKILWQQRRYRLIRIGRKIERRMLAKRLRSCGVILYKDGSVSVVLNRSTALYIGILDEQ